MGGVRNDQQLIFSLVPRINPRLTILVPRNENFTQNSQWELAGYPVKRRYRDSRMHYRYMGADVNLASAKAAIMKGFW